MADDASQDSTTPPADTPPPPAPGEDALGDAGKQALDRMKAERNEAAKRAKALEAELEKVRQAQMSESEKAVAEAEARGRQSALTEVGQRLVRSDFLAAAARRNAEYDAAAVLDDLNLAKFVGADGEPDEKQIAAAVERLVPAPQTGPRPLPGQGPQVTPAPLDDSPRSQILAGLSTSSKPR